MNKLIDNITKLLKSRNPKNVVLALELLKPIQITNFEIAKIWVEYPSFYNAFKKEFSIEGFCYRIRINSTPIDRKWFYSFFILNDISHGILHQKIDVPEEECKQNEISCIEMLLNEYYKN